MGEDRLTVGELLRMQAWVRGHTITPLVVRTEDEAVRFNDAEMAMREAFVGYHGHHWQVGDRYYLFLLHGGAGSLLAQYGPVPA